MSSIGAMYNVFNLILFLSSIWSTDEFDSIISFIIGDRNMCVVNDKWSGMKTIHFYHIWNETVACQ